MKNHIIKSLILVPVVWIIIGIFMGDDRPLWWPTVSILLVILAMVPVWIQALNISASPVANNNSKSSEQLKPAEKTEADNNPQAFTVKAYASILEAQDNGWSFDSPIGRYGQIMINKFARFEQSIYEFSGLSTETTPFVQDHQRLFGRLMYTRVS